MFAPSINVDFEKLRGEEEPEEKPAPRKAKATPKSKAGTADTKATKAE